MKCIKRNPKLVIINNKLYKWHNLNKKKVADYIYISTYVHTFTISNLIAPV